MLTSKQRANLKSLASVMKPVGQVGKEGITENVVKGFSDAIEARELIKVTLLSQWADEKREISELLAQGLKAELVAIIGNKAIFYRKAKRKEPHIVF